MDTRKLPLPVAIVLALGALVVVLGSTAPTVRADSPAELEACATPIAKQWNIKGNCGTTAGTHFIGTTDNQALVVKTNKVERMRLDTSGMSASGRPAQVRS